MLAAAFVFLVSTPSTARADAPQALSGSAFGACENKGVVPATPEYLENGQITLICDGDSFQALETVKAAPIRKGIGTGDPQATLDVNGAVKIGNDPDDCTAKKAGTIRFTGANFEGCNGAAWVSLEAGTGQ